LEIAVFLIERLDYATITKRLYITENTLKSHVTHIYHKFDVSGRKELSEYLQSMPDSETDTDYEIN
jgi:DNA-binding CsgD family transcriptional regulator